jgi:hypothetical protein
MGAAEPTRPSVDETAEREDAAARAAKELGEADAPTGEDAPRDEFLLPGPTSTSNEGLARWGLSWIIFSVVLMGVMALISFVCLVLANWTGFA